MGLVEDFRKAISQAAPCGEDVRYDDDYAFINAELSKATDSDWSQVVKLGRAILAEKSKDLNVATWLCIGLLQTDGYAGLAEGFEAYRALLQEHWDGLFPTSPRGRKNALEMLRSRLGGDARTAGFVEAKPATAEDRDTLGKIVETLKAFEAYLQEKLPDESFDGFFYSITSAVRDKLDELEAPTPAPQLTTPPPKPQPTQPKVAPAVQKPDPKPTSAATGPQAKPVATEGWQNRNQVMDTLIRASAFLREQDPKSPTAYRLLRMLRWDSQQQLPLDKTLTLPVDEKNYRDHLDRLVESEDWVKLLEQTESLFADGCHFWLDLQRYADIALKALGSDYAAVRMASTRETAALLERLPKIAELSYRGNVAFADEETKAWLAKEVSVSRNGKESSLRSGQTAATQQAPATEAAPRNPAVTVSNADSGATTQRIDVGTEGAHVDIQIRIYTK